VVSSGGDPAEVSGRDEAVWFVVAAMSAVALTLAGVERSWAPLAPDVGIPPVALLAVIVATDLWVVHLPMGRSRWSFSLSEIPLFVAVLTLAPGTALSLRVAGAAIALPLAGVRGAKLGFNLASGALEATVAIALLRPLLGDHDPLGPASLAACVLAGLLVNALSSTTLATVIRLTDPTPDVSRRHLLATGSASVLANVCMAFSAAVLINHDPWVVVALVPLGLMILAALRGWTSLHRRFDHLQAVHDFIAALGGEVGLVPTTRVILTETARMLQASTAELAVLTTTAAVHYQLVEGSVVASAALPPWWVAVAGTDEDVRPEAVVVDFPIGDDVRAALLVRDRLAAGDPFDERDARLLDLLAGHAAARLRAAELFDELRAEAAEKAHQSLHDWLTGLPNRRYFMQCTAAALLDRDEVAVLVVDLDRFKQINDTLGHTAGDGVLVAVAERLRTLATVEDHQPLIARLGGDEFAVLLPGADNDAAEIVARAVVTCLDQPVTIADLAVEVGASVGIAASPEHGQDAEALLQHADVAMYQAKAAGSRIEKYNADRDENDVRRLALVSELRKDIEDDRIEIALQPVVEARDGRIVGAECLARWTSPVWGPVPPDEFIAIAEATGLIRLLTERVLRQALDACASWRAVGHDLGVSVNISPRNLLGAGLHDLVTSALERSGLPGSSLTLEITESSLIGDPDRTSILLQQLREHGVRISIDDFGTGYSSLSYLSRLAVDELKVDRSFVADLRRDGGRAIVAAAMHMAHDLGLRVVAEGVEDAETWEELAALSCDLIQGYYVARPQAPAVFADWLDSQPRHRGRTIAAVNATSLAVPA
jgi:diguanylate cyclase (GGDEF)-like protein